MNDAMHAYPAACVPGAEKTRCEELRELGFAGVRLNRGAISFRGTRRDGWCACLESRIAQAVYLLLRTGPAPLRETLAAALLWIAGWARETPLLDPMCGSGTIAPCLPGRSSGSPSPTATCGATPSFTIFCNPPERVTNSKRTEIESLQCPFRARTRGCARHGCPGRRSSVRPCVAEVC